MMTSGGQRSPIYHCVVTFSSGFHSNMDTELFMECEEEELEPWQQVDDSVEEDDMDFIDSYCEPGENTHTHTEALFTPGVSISPV